MFWLQLWVWQPSTAHAELIDCSSRRSGSAAPGPHAYLYTASVKPLSGMEATQERQLATQKQLQSGGPGAERQTQRM